MSEQKWLNCRLSDSRLKLKERGHDVSKPVMSRLLRAHGSSLRANRKQAAGKQHPERDTQFRHLQAQRAEHQVPGATHLLLEADSGGSTSARSRVWKERLQAEVADRFGLHVTVCQYPSGASKWHPSEHRLFSEISKTWAGCPLRSFEQVVGSIEETPTATGCGEGTPRDEVVCDGREGLGEGHGRLEA